MGPFNDFNIGEIMLEKLLVFVFKRAQRHHTGGEMDRVKSQYRQGSDPTENQNTSNFREPQAKSLIDRSNY